MNIYIVSQDKIKNTNYFVDELVSMLSKVGFNVKLGLDILWTDEVFKFDIVYFQWPDYIYNGKLSKTIVNNIFDRLTEIKKHNIKIFVHCHNLRPHIVNSSELLDLYEIIYSNADVMIHMGKYSKDLMKTIYPNVKHYIVPHHTYNAFNFDRDSKSCKEILKLPNDKINVLCFGQFRNNTERKFILELKKKLPSNKFNFITPGFYRERLKQNNLLLSCKVILWTLWYKICGIKFSRKLINDELTEIYFCAADVILIQRPQILNSGNLPMAFSAGKAVIGPNIGNVGTILHETNNITFDIDYQEMLCSVLLEIEKCELEKIGRLNKEYAQKHWSHDVLGATYKHIIAEILTS